MITPTSTREFAIVAWLAVLGNFAASLWLSPGFSVNSLYVVAILMAIWVPDTRLAYRLAALSTVLIFSNALIVPRSVAAVGRASSAAAMITRLLVHGLCRHELPSKRLPRGSTPSAR